MTWMKNLTAGLALAVAIVNGSGSALAQNKVARSQAITIDPPGAGMAAGQGTFAQQGLNSGTIVGYYIDADAVAHGFIRSVDGNWPNGVLGKLPSENGVYRSDSSLAI